MIYMILLKPEKIHDMTFFFVCLFVLQDPKNTRVDHETSGENKYCGSTENSHYTKFRTLTIEMIQNNSNAHTPSFSTEHKTEVTSQHI